MAWAMASVVLVGVALVGAGIPTPASHTDNGRRIFLHGMTSTGRVVENSHGMEGVGCAMCHGPDMKGIGPVPPIAGRSPSYLMRQMYDMKAGTRKGMWTGLMKPVVAALSEEDLMNLSAYMATLKP